MANKTKELFVEHKFNTAVAASANETITAGKGDRVQYAPHNFLLVTNRDDVDIKLELDGLSEPGKIFELGPGDVLSIKAEDGVKFSFIKQTNLDAATAQTANKILFRFGTAILEEVN